MSFDEGVIKFKPHWIKSYLSDFAEASEMNLWRKKLYELKLIGAYEGDIGYGNISMRIGEGLEFIISGSGTGNADWTGTQHYTRVIDFSLKNNSVTCVGPIVASSESLTHAMLYEFDPKIKVVVHAHHRGLWTSLLHKIPTTQAHISYGTVEMAMEVKRLFDETELRRTKLFAMAGHPDGLISFGSNFAEACQLYFDLLNKK